MIRSLRSLRLPLAAVLAVSMSAASVLAAEKLGPDPEKLSKSRQQAIDFLKTTQSDDGGWTTPNAPGIAALVTYALLESGVPADDPTVKKALDHLASFEQKDGGVYYSKSNHRNYETCIVLMAYVAANQDGRYDDKIAAAEKFLKGLQWDEGEGIESSDTKYGGAGYGSHQRPDLSNTSFLIEALKTAGVKEDDPAMKKALVFVSRTQNLETEHNTTPFAAKINDGGFYYTPAAGGTSQAGMSPEGGLRSYGSMTYAGLKSMVYAGLDRDDPRVKAAFDWIRRFYTVEENPGMGEQGLFYYYQTFGKALDTLGVDYLEDAKGKKHDWRKDLAEQLFKLQNENGSWVNKAERWYEGDPNLATAYALMALAHTEPKPAAPAAGK